MQRAVKGRFWERVCGEGGVRGSSVRSGRLIGQQAATTLAGRSKEQEQNCDDRSPGKEHRTPGAVSHHTSCAPFHSYHSYQYTSGPCCSQHEDRLEGVGRSESGRRLRRRHPGDPTKGHHLVQPTRRAAVAVHQMDALLGGDGDLRAVGREGGDRVVGCQPG